MPYSAFMRGSLRTSRVTRPTKRLHQIGLEPTLLPFSRNPRNPRFAPTMMKDASSYDYGTEASSARPRLRSVIITPTTRTSPDLDWRGRGRTLLSPNDDVFPFWQQSSQYARYAADDYSEDDSDRDMDTSSIKSSTLDNVDEWKWKLNMLLRNNNEQELVSRERKERRDYEQLAALATRMGLYSKQYSRVVVFSKVPLPNYRSDLDDKRPQREVSVPIDLQREVGDLLDEYLAQKRRNRGDFQNMSISRSSSNGSMGIDDGLFEQSESNTSPNPTMERIMRRRSLHLLDQQRAWQESSEGQKMQKFRKSLPSYKERDALLRAVSHNQRNQ